MDKSTAILCRSDFIWNVERCAAAQSIFAQPQTMDEFASPSDQIEQRRMVQQVTLQKLLLIAVALALGAAAASLLSGPKSPVSISTMAYLTSADSSPIKSPRRTETTNRRDQFIERSSIPDFAASGALHNNWDVDYEY